MNISFTEKEQNLNTTIVVENYLIGATLYNEAKVWENINPDISKTLIQKSVFEKLDNNIPSLTKQYQQISSIILEKFKGRIKPVHYLMNLNQFLYHYFEEMINQNYLYFPNENDLLVYRKILITILSRLRYANEPNFEKKTIIEKALAFFNASQNALKLVGELDEQEVVHSENLLELIKVILDNPDVLNMSLSYFIQPTLPKITQAAFLFDFSVILLKNHLHSSLERLKLHFTFIGDLIEEEMKKFLTLRQHAKLNPTKALLNALKTFRKDTFPLLNTLNVEDFSNLMSSLPKLKKILKEFHNLFNLSTNPNKVAFDDTSNDTFIMQAIYDHIKDKSANTVICLDDYNEKLINGVLFRFYPDIIKGKWTIKETEELKFCYKARTHCHQLADSFINPIVSHILLDVIPHLTSWHNSHANKKYFAILLKVISPKKKIEPPPPTTNSVENKSVDELAKWIEGDKPTTISNKTIKTAKKVSSVPSKIKTVPKKNEKPQVKEKAKTTTHSKKHDFIEAFSEDDLAILSMIGNELASSDSTKIPEAFAALRESFMYLMDAILINQQLEKNKTLDPNQRSFWLLDLIHRLHDFPEQALRHHNIIKLQEKNNDVDQFGHHNLKGLYRQLNPDETMKIPSVVNKFFLANFWLEYHPEQTRRWQSIPHKTPPALLEKIRLIIDDPSSKKIEDIQKELQSDLQDMFAFLKELFPKANTNVLQSWKSVELTPNQSIDTEVLDTALTQVRTLREKLTWTTSHPIFDKFQQLEDAIKFLIQGYTLLNKPIQSILVSSVMRSNLAAQSSVVELFLLLIHEVKKGESVRNHNIEVISSMIPWSTEIKAETLDFLKKEYVKARKTSHNPFQEITIVNLFHRIIVKSELGRERPELINGDESQDDEVKTPLNFLSLSSKDKALSYETIFQEAKTLFDQTLSSIIDELLQELTDAI